MSATTQWIIQAVAIGVGATAVMDIWAVFQRRVFGVSSLDYRLVGRWLGHLIVRGQFRHDAIAKAPPIALEKPIGWSAHYAIGILFAAALLQTWGSRWAHAPTLVPALVVGIGTVVIPFLILQPALGAGVAGSRTPNPTSARLKSLTTHGVFAIGLYLSAQLTRFLLPQ